MSDKRRATLRRVSLTLATAVALAVALGEQSANWRSVFLPQVGGEGATRVVAFTDGDCYARMTRARMVFRRPGSVVREHGFENFPRGVRPHTTAPLDYAIAALARVLRAWWPPAGDGALDLAGAWISPVFGAGTLGFLAWWVGRRRRERPGIWAGVLALAAGSPILAHGFAVGRPDHQSLELACVAVGLAAEFSQFREPSRAWALTGGAAWGLGLWVSLYEPLLLLGGCLVVSAAGNPSAFWSRGRLVSLAVATVVLLLAGCCEGGWRVELPGIIGGGGNSADAGLFAAWAGQIGELRGVPPWSPVLFRWCGWGLAMAPLALWLASRRAPPGAGDRRIARGWMGLLVGVWALTCWQLRWGYFLALVAAMSLPWQALALVGRPRSVRWIVGVVWTLGLFPLATESATRLNTLWRGAGGPAQAERVQESLALRGVADFLRRESALDPENGAGGVLAPWWLSPALAYWSELPAVAGSSHESLAGTADAARLFLFSSTRDWAEARALLARRRVRWVVIDDDPERTLPTALSLLGRGAAPADALGAVLARFPERAPPGLRLAYVNPLFKVYAAEASGYANGP